MKKTILMLATAIFFMGILEGCRKTIADATGNGNGGTTTNLLKTMTTIDYNANGSGARVDSIIDNVSYDSQNRFSQILRTTYNFNPLGISKDTTTFTYNTKTVILNEDGQITTYYLNTNGTLADSARNQVQNFIYVQRYFYDANGYLTEMDSYTLTNLANGGVSSSAVNKIGYTIASGNITNEVYSSLANGVGATSSSIYTNQTRPSGVPLPDGDNQNIFNNGLAGRASLDLQATYSSSVVASSQYNFAYAYSYMFDSLSRVSVITAKMTKYNGTEMPYTAYLTYY